jgi:2-oxoisovalerate dehydrogenase E1 component alpha subunit
MSALPASHDDHDASAVPAPDLQLRLYETMVLARRLSERLLQLQRAGIVPLAVPCDGHEAAQVGSALALPDDPARRIVYPYYRSLAAVLAYGMTPLDLMLGFYAKQNDPSTGGHQMPAHYSRRDLNIVTTSSVIATQIPHAVGAAYAAKLRRLDQVAITYFGEGATSAADFHTGVNFAAIHRLPVIFVCENNQYAISVPQAKQMAIANVADRAAGYGITGTVVDGNDVEAVYQATRAALERARAGEGPTLLECKTYRLAPHTSDDDDRGYRPPEEIALWRRERDPIPRYARVLRERAVLNEQGEAAVAARVRQALDEATAATEASPDPDLTDIAIPVYYTANVPGHGRMTSDE